MTVPADLSFDAPWGTSLKVMTLLGCIVLLGIPLIGGLTGPRTAVWWLLMVVLPLAILVSTAFFTVRGYSLQGHTLYVQRLGWHTRIDLSHLETAIIDSQAMDKSIRTWGNGGLFGFVGHFRNQRLGAYYAYATKLDNAVVLTLPQQRLVVTPNDPERFVQAVSAMNT